MNAQGSPIADSDFLPMTPLLLWNRNQKEIHSVQELDEFLDKLTSEIQDGIGHVVQLEVNEATGLMITIGSSLSHVEFYSANARPPVAGYYADEGDDEELFHFLSDGVPSSVKKRSCVSIETAREAMRLYYLTGDKPKNIDWQT